MANIKKGDFIEIEYTGSLKDDNLVFDTTDSAVAKANDLFNPQMSYGPVTVCLGQGHLLEGLEKELEGKEIGKNLTIHLSPEKAFGKKDAGLIRLIPMSAFKKQNIMPQPGLQVNVDGMTGIVKTAAGGRCMVDFNHPLSGRDIVYIVKVHKIVTDDAEKIKGILKLSFNLDAEVSVKENNAEIKAKKEIPKEIVEVISSKLKEIIPSVKKYNFAEISSVKPVKSSVSGKERLVSKNKN